MAVIALIAQVMVARPFLVLVRNILSRMGDELKEARKSQVQLAAMVGLTQAENGPRAQEVLSAIATDDGRAHRVVDQGRIKFLATALQRMKQAHQVAEGRADPRTETLRGQVEELQKQLDEARAGEPVA